MYNHYVCIVFNYGAGHTVDEVKESDYKSCTTGNSLSTDSSGTTTITLKTAGTHYFICAAPAHCDGGMKLAVKVKANKKASAPALAPSPSGKDSPSLDDTKDKPTPTTTSTTPTSTTPSTDSTPTTSYHTSHSSSLIDSSLIVAMFFVSWISSIVLSLV